MKTCTKCKIEKPFEAFYKSKRAKDGFTYECIECIKARKKELKKSPLMQLERQIRSSVLLENKLLAREGKRLCGKCNEIFLIEDLTTRGYCEKCNIEHSKEYYQKNKDKIKEYNKEYQQKNKDKTREHSRKSSNKYYEKNKDKAKEISKEWREKNREKNIEYQREYRLKKKLEKESQIVD